MIKPRTFKSVEYLGAVRSAHSTALWVRNPQGNNPLRRPGNKWKDNIKMDLKGANPKDVARINLVQKRIKWLAILHMVMKLRFF